MKLILTTAFCAISTVANADIKTDVWVDNWFQMSVNGTQVLEDGTAYRTERSFNADTATFAATYPMTVAVEMRDYMENDTGLEYIGARKQQMGDGGGIIQFTDTVTGIVVGATDASWKCLPIHIAPLDPGCADESNPELGSGTCEASITVAPAGWDQPGFDDSAWPNAVTHSESAVRPKDGYDRVDWDGSAQIIWSESLVQDNIVLCRATITD